MFWNNKKGCGAFDPPVDERDFQREYFFGGEEREVPKEFDHSTLYPITNQYKTMGCGYFSASRVLATKFTLETGKRLDISDEFILSLWKKGCSLGFGNEKVGSYIYDFLKFLHKYPQKFPLVDGGEVEIQVEKYFVVDRSQIEEETYFGGGVLTGTSSRLGLWINQAKYRPYFPKDQKSNRNDGHAFPIQGKRMQNFWVDVRNGIREVMALVHPNSYSKAWGNKGTFYTHKGQRKGLFRVWGFTIKHDYLTDKEKVRVEETSVTKKEIEDFAKRITLFKDVGTKSWYTSAISKAKEKGVMKGYDDGTFRPGKAVNRAELCVILDRLGLLD